LSLIKLFIHKAARNYLVKMIPEEDISA